jgi:hypothetical protein
MQRIGTVTLMSLFVLVVLASMLTGEALATNPQYNRGPNCSDNGLTATCTGRITGLGNFDVLIRLSASALVDTVCKAPGKNGTEAPGQNPALTVNVSGGLLIDSSDIKNGNLSFTVTTTAPATPSPSQVGCPNDNWTVRITNVTFSNGQLSVFQDRNGDGAFDASELVIGPTSVSIL